MDIIRDVAVLIRDIAREVTDPPAAGRAPMTECDTGCSWHSG